MKKLLLIMMVLTISLLFVGNVYAENISTQNEEVPLLVLDESQIQTYFNFDGEAVYEESDNKIQLVNTSSEYQTGTSYFNQRLSLAFDFLLEVDISIYNYSGTVGDGLAFGFTESDIGTQGENGNGLGVVGTQNTTAFVIDTYRNSTNEPATPSMAVRYTKNASDKTNFYDVAGNATGRLMPSVANGTITKDTSDFKDQLVRLTIQYIASTQEISFTILDETLTGTMEGINSENGVSFFMSSATGESRDSVELYIKNLEAYLVTLLPTDVVVEKKEDGDIILTPVKPVYVTTDTNRYAEGTAVFIPGIETPFLVNSEGNVVIPKYQAPQYDIDGPLYVKDADKGVSDNFDVFIPGYQTIDPMIETVFNEQGDVTYTIKKPDGTSYPASTMVQFPGLSDTYVIGEEDTITFLKNDLPEYDSSGILQVTQLTKDSSEGLTFVTPGYKTMTLSSSDQEQDISSNITLVPRKTNGDIYKEGTIVTLGFTDTNFVVNQLGEIYIPADLLEQNDFQTTMILQEPLKDVSDQVTLEIKGFSSGAKEANKIELQHEAIRIKEAIDALSYLSTNEKNDEKNHIDLIFSQGSNAIGDSGDEETIALNYKNYLASMESVLLDAQKNDAIKDLEDYASDAKDEIDESSHLTQNQKEALKDEIDQLVLGKINQLEVAVNDELIAKILSDAKGEIDYQLQNAENQAKQNSRTSLLNQAEVTKLAIGNFEYLTQDEKSIYYDSIDQLLINSDSLLEEAVSLAQIESIDQTYASYMEDTLLNGFKENKYNQLRLFKDSLGLLLETLTTLSVDEKTAANGNLNEIYLQAKDNMALLDTDANISQEYDDAVTEMTKTVLIYQKIDATNQMKHKAESLEQSIDALAYLDDQRKLYYKELLDNEKQSSQAIVDQANNAMDVKSAQDSYNEKVDALYLTVKKENAEQIINDYVESLFGSTPSQDIIDLKNQIMDDINQQVSVSGIDDILANGVEALDQYLTNVVEVKRAEVREMLETYAGTPKSDEIDHIIETYVNQIDGNNHFDIYETNKIIDEGKNAIDERKLREKKDEVIAVIENELILYMGPIQVTNQTHHLLSQAIDEIEDQTTIQGVEGVFIELIERIIYLNQIEDLIQAIDETYQTYQDLDVYSDSAKSELEAIYEQAVTELRAGHLDIVEATNRALIMIEALDSVLINRIMNDEFTLKDANLEYLPDGNQIYVGIENDLGFEKDVKVAVNILETLSDNIAKINELIENNQIVLKGTHTLTLEKMRENLKKQEAIHVLEIKLLDDSNQVINQFNGNYMVSFLLTEELRSYANIKVIYLNEAHIEVYEVERDGNWAIFTTTHFSDFYIMVDIEEETNQTALYLGWIIALLIIIIFEIIIMIMKKRNNQLKLRSALYPISYFVIPQVIGIGTILVLAAIIIILAVYIVWLFIRGKHAVSQPQENSDAKQMTEVFDTMGMSHDEDMQRLEPKSGETGLYIRYNYSFIARLKQTPRTSQQKLSELKNYVLSFEGVTVRKSRGYERFMYQGKPILKIWIHGQITDIYFNLEPKAYQDSKYELEDMSENKMHERRPACLKLSGTRFLEYAKELVDIYMKEGQQKKEVAQMDDRLSYVSKEKLS